MTLDLPLVGADRDAWGEKLNTAANGLDARLQKFDNYVPLTAWRAAVANRFFAPARAMFLGDSITEGQGATAQTNRFMARFRDAMRLRYPVSGVAGGVGFLPASWSETTFTKPFTTGGAPTAVTAYGFGGRAYQLAQGTDTLSITVSGTSFDLVFTEQTPSAGVTAGVSIDGGAVQNVDVSGAVEQDGYKHNFVFGARGSHTIAISAVAGTPVIDGIYVYDQDENAGIHTIDASHGGWSTNDYLTLVNNGSLAQQVNLYTPQLIVITLGANDYYSFNSASFQANLSSIISTINTARASRPPSIVLQMVYERNDAPASDPWSAYVLAATTVAASNTNVSVLDLSARMPRVANDLYSLYADSLNPTNKGHSLIADALASFVSPR